MPLIQSKLDVAGEAFQRNRAGMLKLIERLRHLEARTRDESAKARPLFEKRGQLLPRERIALLLDDGVIDPRDTRNVLGYVLSICKHGDVRTVRPVQFGVARP